MLSNRRFYGELNNEGSRWGNQKNGLPQDSVLSPLLFSIYANDQPLHDETCNFIYSDDLCVTAQHTSFNQVEATVEEALAPNDTAYKRWSCHSGHKLLCKLCRTFPPPAMGPIYRFFWERLWDPLDDRRSSHKNG